MRLYEILDGIDCERANIPDREITGIEIDSRCVSEGDIFVAMRGSRYNGENYIADAIERGAQVVVAECDGANTMKVANIREAYALMASNFYGKPSKKLKIIAVVGTNGKSTSAYFAYEILKYNGYKVGLIGTGYVMYNDIVKENDMTTPDPMALHGFMREMTDNGIEYVVMEVSAHAIYLEKMYGIKCELGLFTNFSEDHLDFFREMDIYKRVKMSFFNSRYIKVGIVNSDDKCGREILASTNVPAFSYGLDSPSDVFAIDIEYCIDGTRFVVNMLDEISRFATDIVGRYNVYNILGASLIARLLGIPMYGVRDAVESLHPLDGRYNVIRTDKANFVVDYAHTPIAMKNVIMETRRVNSGKIFVIFGCGGNRDRIKRPIMGEIAVTLADTVIVTSDNSRDERTEDIISDILDGVDREKVVVLPIREDAIRYAYEMSDKGDVVLVLGKGAEKYTDNEGNKTYYSDREAILEVANMRR